jgi:hypothetical protein
MCGTMVCEKRFTSRFLMEAVMRSYFMISMVGCTLACAASISAPAMADWHSPYVHRETSGSWTNIEFDDGVCHIYFAHNSYDNNTKVERRGDCSRVVIGPDGMPVYATPMPAPVIRRY